MKYNICMKILHPNNKVRDSKSILKFSGSKLKPLHLKIQILHK